MPRDWYLGLPAPGRVQGYHGPDMVGTLGVADAAVVWMGSGPYDYTGYQLHGDDDVDGDGRPDLVIAVPDDVAYGVGAVYVLSGPSW